jgi:hypothetical protein
MSTTIEATTAATTTTTTTAARAVGPLPPDRLRVPWKTVVALAAVMAYADGYWETSLRGAIGAIERTQSPFASWWQESTLLLPVFIVAVLGALTLAMRWFGPVLLRPRTVAVTALLIVAAGTLAGLATIAANSAYDYHLQVHQLQMMDAMRSPCPGNCLAAESHATLLVHVRGALYILRWLLLTNVVLVAWLVAMWGGRLKISTIRLPHSGPADIRPSTAGRVSQVRWLLVGALVAGAAIHATLVPDHRTGWTGVLFILLAIWQVTLAYLLLARLEERTVLLATALLSAGALSLWLSTHPANLADTLAAALDLTVLLTAVLLLRGTRWLSRRPPGSAHVTSLVLVTLLAVTIIGVAATGLSWFDAFDLSGNLMNMPH